MKKDTKQSPTPAQRKNPRKILTIRDSVNLQPLPGSHQMPNSLEFMQGKVVRRNSMEESFTLSIRTVPTLDGLLAESTTSGVDYKFITFREAEKLSKLSVPTVDFSLESAILSRQSQETQRTYQEMKTSLLRSRAPETSIQLTLLHSLVFLTLTSTMMPAERLRIKSYGISLSELTMVLTITWGREFL